MLQKAGCVVEPMDDVPREMDGVTWQRLVCRDGRAVAIAAVAEESDRGDRFLVLLSTDIRRLPRFWRFPGDLLLAKRLSDALVREGAVAIQDD